MDPIIQLNGADLPLSSIPVILSPSPCLSPSPSSSTSSLSPASPFSSSSSPSPFSFSPSSPFSSSPFPFSPSGSPCISFTPVSSSSSSSSPSSPSSFRGIENLVFRGGGVKGAAYCGALKVLDDLHLIDNVKRYAGSSAGAIAAALLAVGYSVDELKELYFNMNMSEFKDGKNILSKAERLYKKFALYEGNYFFSWISSCIEKKTNANITFKQLYEKYKKELVIVGACVSHMDVVYFNFRDFPNMEIREALRISMSIPIFFEPVRIEDHVYVDGGLADNFPLYVFDSEDDLKNARHADINMQTLGLFLQDNKTRHDTAREVENIKDFIGCLLDTVKTRIAMLSIKPGDEDRTMFIQTHHISATQFNISNEEKELLYDEGAKAARKYVSQFLPAEFVKSPTWGRLIVKLKSGGGFHTHLFAVNLHCVLTLGNVSKKTNSVRKKSKMNWEDHFVFPVNNEEETFKVEVFEGVLGTSRLLGQYSAPVLNFKDQHCVETVIDIGKGSITLDMTLSIY